MNKYSTLHKSLLIFILLIVLPLSLSAQRNMGSAKVGILSGVIIDSITKTNLEYVSIKLLNAKDSAFVTGIYSGSDGEFLLDQIPAGKYIAKLTLMNYKVKWINDISFSTDKPDRVLGTVKLSNEKTTVVDEVQVIANKKILETSFDKKVYNVAEDISSKGGSVNDVLNNVPSVEVDQDGKISLRGDGNVTILIDGRPSTLSGSSGKSMLEALPANMVERIELVTNPSAKYDPDGTSGIINIVLKKNKLRGVNGNVSLSAATGNIFNGSTSLSLRNSKMNLYGTYSYRHYEGERNNYGQMDRYFGDSLFSLKQDRKGTDYNIGNTIKLGADFYLKDRNTLGFAVTGSQGERNRTGDLTNRQLDGLGYVLSQWTRNSLDPSRQKNMDVNMNYKFDFKEDKGSLVFDATQSFGTDTTGGVYIQDYANTQDLNQQLSSDESNRFSTIMLDYVRVLKRNIRIEAGTKAIIRNSTVLSSSETLDTISNKFQKDSLSNFNYQYDERIFSTYGNFAQHINKFKYQVGARIEQSYQTPNLVSENKIYKKEYFNVFPSAFLTYTFKKDLELTLNYSKRINRPTSENLNPFSSYSDPYNLRRGNPEVNPEFIDSYEMGIGSNKKTFSLNASIFYRNTTNVLQRYRMYYPSGYAAVTYVNIDRSESIGSELILTFRPIPTFKNVLSFNGNQIKYYDDVIVFKNNVGFNWSVKYTGAYEFWKRTASVQINAKYNAPIVTAQGKVQPRASMDISGEKSLKEGHWSIGFKVSDIFNTQEFRIQVDQQDVIQFSTFKQTTRRFYVNLNYKFGKMEVTKKGKISQDNNSGGGDF
jgi:outer membrane receptor protein involved in Fe transport